MPSTLSMLTSDASAAMFLADARDQRGIPARLWRRALAQPAEEFLSRPRKRLRSELIRAAFRMAGGKGKTPTNLVHAIELLHAGSLIIDDIEDDSSTRRGHATLHRLIGTPKAINTGNWMYFRAFDMLMDLDLPSKIQAEVAARTAKTIRRCHEGQALDIGVRVDDLQQGEVLPVADGIATLKTGGLMALASWLGASMAGADRDLRDAMERWGLRLGVALQMVNDLEELRASTSRTGRYDDLRNGRVTWAWAWLAGLSPPAEFVWLQQQVTPSADEVELRFVASEILSTVEEHGRFEIIGQLSEARREVTTALGDHPELERLTDRIRQVLEKNDSR